MELKIKRDDFLKALALTQNIVEKKSTMPILANVLLEAKNKTLRINATDLEVGVSVVCPAEGIKEGKVTVLAKGLFDIIRELPNELISIKQGENNWLSIICGKSRFKIAGMSFEEFPQIPAGKDAEVYTEERDLLLGMINKVSFAMSTDETRYNLNGVFLHGEKGGDGFKFAATDGHRLSVVYRKPKSKWKLGNGIIIPKKGVFELKKILESYEGVFSFKIDGKNLTVEKENVQLVVRLIEGQFPPYDQVIPRENKRILSVEKEIFIKALRRVSLMASDKTRGVKFQLSPGHLEISTSNPDFGEAVEEIDVAYKGETFSVGFNSRYFLDVLGVLEDEKVVLEFKDEVSPCMIRSEFDKGLMNVIMPMRM